ncbi:MAG TPA: hypothetical protein VGK12_03205 [Actinomycetota bacterium]
MDDRLPPPPPARPDDALQYTHSGDRYLLGYGDAYFGIWARASEAPVARFPRTLEGWQAAWRRYADLQPVHSDVGLGSTPIPAPVAATAAATTARLQERPGRAVGAPAHPAWWLLPILMGWMGGLIAWAMIRDHDRARARAMLVTGIVASAAWIVLYSVLVPVPRT